MTPPASRPAARGMVLRPAAAHTFASIAGHELIKRYLGAAIAGRSLPHALLFQGPRGTGKTSMAHALARVLNCPTGAPEGCPCHICRKITTGVFADLVLVEPRGAAGQITLAGWKPGNDPDNQQYYRFVDSRPMEGGRKLLIIRQAERMNVAVANHLLKLIEEPPSYLTLVLVTHRPGDLLRTVRSRCAPLKFSPLEEPEMRRFLNVCAPDTNPASVGNLFRLAEGRPGLLAEMLAGGVTNRGRITAEAMARFQSQGFPSIFRVASDLAKSGGGTSADDFEAVLDGMQGWVRDTLLMKVLPESEALGLVLNPDAAPLLREYAAAADEAALVRVYDELADAHAFAPRQTDKAFVLETLLLRVGRLMRR